SSAGPFGGPLCRPWYPSCGGKRATSFWPVPTRPFWGHVGGRDDGSQRVIARVASVSSLAWPMYGRATKTRKGRALRPAPVSAARIARQPPYLGSVVA